MKFAKIMGSKHAYRLGNPDYEPAFPRGKRGEAQKIKDALKRLGNHNLNIRLKSCISKCINLTGMDGDGI